MCNLHSLKFDNPSLRRLPSVRGGVTILWLDDVVRSNCYHNDTTRDYLKNLTNDRIIHFTSMVKCRKYLKQAPSYERIILVHILHRDYGDQKEGSMLLADLSRLYHYEQVESILIVLLSKNDSKADTKNNLLADLSNASKKIHGVFHDHQSVLMRLQQTLLNEEEHDDGLFASFNRREKSFLDVHQELGVFVWSHSYRAILKAMPNESSQAKREMLAECRAQYHGNKHVLAQIDDFQRIYRSEDAIYWYTKNSFLYRIINKALRTEDIFALYTFRYFIVDLSNRLEEVAAVMNTHRPEQFRVYRGSNLHLDEVRKLRVGTLVATNGFLSTSTCLNVAEAFIYTDVAVGAPLPHYHEHHRQRVIFEIDVDRSHSSNLIVADISGQSVIADENEILFGLGATFTITCIDYDVNNYVWRIRMVSSAEVAKLSQKYDRYIQQRLRDTKPAILFGHLLVEVTSDYIKAMTYFHRLLRAKTTDIENYPNIYYQLARIYRYLGKYMEAIAYFRQAQILQRHLLPQSKLDYGRTLAGLGTTYCELGDTKRAVRLYERVMDVYRGSLPYDHVERGFHLNRLAYAMWQEQRYEQALALLTSSLSFFNQHMPENHPGHAEALHNMGLVRYALGHYEQSVDYLRKALRMRELSLADDHPFLARTCYQLSEVLAELDHQNAEALEYADRAFSIRKKKLPRSHFELKQSMNLVNRLSQVEMCGTGTGTNKIKLNWDQDQKTKSFC